MAGFSPEQAPDAGLKLLYSKPCRRILSKISEQPPTSLQALCAAGLARLAFGAANDAVRLAFGEDTDPAVIEGLDLFHVSELKRVKGGVEIKLFDRQKALEKLLEYAGTAGSEAAAAALLEAIGGEVCESGNVLSEAENRAPVVGGTGNPES